MAEEKAPPRKQGLHGWKAAAAVFGCGTLAAFGMFGALVGLASVFFSTVSSGMLPEAERPSSGVIPEQTIKPRDDLPTESLDLCGKTIPQVQEVNATRTDSGGNYSDPGEGVVPRSVFDECTWDVFPSGDVSSVWSLRFSYEAFVSDEKGDDAGDQASARFEEVLSKLNSKELSLQSDGPAGVSDNSYYVHGLTEEGTTVYEVVVRSGDTVYEMGFETDQDFPSEELVSVELFEHERDALVNYIEVRLGIIGPG